MKCFFSVEVETYDISWLNSTTTFSVSINKWELIKLLDKSSHLCHSMLSLSKFQSKGNDHNNVVLETRQWDKLWYMTQYFILMCTRNAINNQTYSLLPTLLWSTHLSVPITVFQVFLKAMNPYSLSHIQI